MAALCTNVRRVQHVPQSDHLTGSTIIFDSPHAAAVAVCQVSEADIDKKGDGYVLKSDPSIKVHARAHKVSRTGWLGLLPLQVA
jgi:leucyl-tRNA synthetase